MKYTTSGITLNANEDFEKLMGLAQDRRNLLTKFIELLNK